MIDKRWHSYLKTHIGSGNGLVYSGNKALAEPVLTMLYDVIWRH